MNLTSSLFYFFEAGAALSAISILFVRNVFYGALYLIVCLLCIAAIYVLAFAEFIAVTQIIVYAGGILVLIIFGIMLTAKISGKPLQVLNRNWFAGLIAGVFFFSFFVVFFSRKGFATSQPTDPVSDNTMHSIGILLMTDFILPFEIAGILLLVALIGSAVTASSTKQKANMFPVVHILYLGALLFSIGLMIVIVKRNAIVILLGIELMLNASNLNLIAFNVLHPGHFHGQFFALFVIIAAVCEAAVGLAIILRIYQHHQTAVPDQITELKD